MRFKMFLKAQKNKQHEIREFYQMNQNTLMFKDVICRIVSYTIANFERHCCNGH